MKPGELKPGDLVTVNTCYPRVENWPLQFRGIVISALADEGEIYAANIFNLDNVNITDNVGTFQQMDDPNNLTDPPWFGYEIDEISEIITKQIHWNQGLVSRVRCNQQDDDWLPQDMAGIYNAMTMDALEELVGNQVEWQENPELNISALLSEARINGLISRKEAWNLGVSFLRLL